MPAAPDRVHGTALGLDNAAVLIRGPSGAGKSDLALRCLATPASSLIPFPAVLVADDQVLLTPHNGQLLARSPPNIHGKLEVRGLGILTVPAVDDVPITLVADLVPPELIERLPEDGAKVTLFGVVLPHIQIAPFEHSAAVKLLLALARSAGAER